jgi:hypothetical protein
MWFLDTLVGINAVGTWRGAGHAKRTAHQLRLQNQMLFDAMSDEEKARVIAAAEERQRDLEDRTRARNRRVGLAVVIFLVVGLAAGAGSKREIAKVQAAPPVAAQVAPQPVPDLAAAHKECVDSIKGVALQHGVADPLQYAQSRCDGVVAGQHVPKPKPQQSKQMDCINTAIMIDRMSGHGPKGFFPDLSPYEAVCPK